MCNHICATIYCDTYTSAVTKHILTIIYVYTYMSHIYDSSYMPRIYDCTYMNEHMWSLLEAYMCNNIWAFICVWSYMIARIWLLIYGNNSWSYMCRNRHILQMYSAVYDWPYMLKLDDHIPSVYDHILDHIRVNHLKTVFSHVVPCTYMIPYMIMHVYDAHMWSCLPMRCCSSKNPLGFCFELKNQ